MRHIYPLQVRWGDLDGFGHVNNAAYLTYVQEARVDFTIYARERKNQSPILFDMVVARAEVDYIAPIYQAGVNAHVEVWVHRIGNSSFGLSYEIHVDGQVVAKARTVQVTVDMHTKGSRPLGDAEKEFLQEYFHGE
ncbi:MAG: acyl-CoA thioesterase [Actinobacteria bacterium]|nr:acyl-CoA thioesterase [Actinomycetota bacterium]